MARKPWAGEEQVSSYAGTDNSGLQAQATLTGGGNWSVSDAVAELGSNRRLAEKMLAEKGITEPTSRQISSQMRNIQRWLVAERGETGKQAHKPAKGTQAAINKAGRQAAHGNDSARINIKGSASVNGYKRNRDIEVTLSPDEAEAFFEAIESGNMEDAWGMLASGYDVSELHAYDADIGVNWI